MPWSARTRTRTYLRTRYDTILIEAEAGNPPRPRTRGRVKQAPAYNLIQQLRERRNDDTFNSLVLTFIGQPPNAPLE